MKWCATVRRRSQSDHQHNGDRLWLSACTTYVYWNVHCRHAQQTVVSAALRAVGNIVTGDDVQTQVILNCSALPCLLHLLSSQKESIRKEACWTISNITAGNRAQIQVGILPVFSRSIARWASLLRAECNHFLCVCVCVCVCVAPPPQIWGGGEGSGSSAHRGRTCLVRGRVSVVMPLLECFPSPFDMFGPTAGLMLTARVCCCCATMPTCSLSMRSLLVSRDCLNVAVTTARRLSTRWLRGPKVAGTRS